MARPEIGPARRRIAAGSLEQRLAGLLLPLLCLVACLPILLNPVPPLNDYPGHLSRIHVLAELGRSPVFGRDFAFNPVIVPNLAMDGFVLALVALGIPIEIAGRIFLALIVLLTGTGVVALHRALFRRRALWPLAAFAFVYGETMFYGFANYLFGVGLLLWGAAAWCLMAQRPLRQSAGVLFGFLMLLFFCHLLTMLVLAGLVLGYEASRVVWVDRAGRGVALRRMVVILALLLPPLGLLSLAPLLQVETVPFLDRLLPQLRLDALSWRLRGLPNFARGYDGLTDILSLGGLAVAVLAGLGTRALAVFWRLVLPLVGLAALYLIVPDAWYGTLYLPDRLPLVLFMVALALTDIAVPSRAGVALLGSLVVGLVLGRTAIVERAWAAANAAYAPFLAALDRVPAGARIYTVLAYAGDFGAMVRPPWGGLANYAVIRRDALSYAVTVNDTQNLLAWQPATAERVKLWPGNYRADLASTERHAGFDPYPAPLIAAADYVLVINEELMPRRPPEALSLIAAGPRFRFYRLAGSVSPVK
jgi:hypothetical protein